MDCYQSPILLNFYSVPFSIGRQRCEKNHAQSNVLKLHSKLLNRGSWSTDRPSNAGSRRQQLAPSKGKPRKSEGKSTASRPLSQPPLESLGYHPCEGFDPSPSFEARLTSQVVCSFSVVHGCPATVKDWSYRHVWTTASRAACRLSADGASARNVGMLLGGVAGVWGGGRQGTCFVGAGEAV